MKFKKQITEKLTEKSGNTTSLVVSEEKPVTCKYLWRTNMLKIEAHYMLEINIGTVCSLALSFLFYLSLIY